MHLDKLFIIRYLRLGIFLFFALGSSVAVETLRAESLESVAMSILTQGPEFISETYSIESNTKNLATESNLPDPEIGGEYLVLPKDVDNRWTAELRWSVEWPGVYGARSKESRLKMSAFEKNIWVSRNERLTEIRDLLIDYIQCRQKLTLLEELNQNNDTIYRLADQAARGGEMTVLDLNKIRLEYANIRGAKAALLDEESGIIANLSQIYGKDCFPLIQKLDYVFPGIYLPSPEEIEMIKRNAPSVQAAIAEAQSARQAKSVAKREALPSLSLGYKHAFEDGMHFNGVVWGVSLPIFSSHGKQKAADAAILEAEYKTEAQTMEIDAEVEALISRLQLISQQIDEISPIVENADYNSALLKAYKGGVITLLEYISDRNYFTNAAVELVNLRHSAAKTQSQLQKYLSF